MYNDFFYFVNKRLLSYMSRTGKLTNEVLPKLQWFLKILQHLKKFGLHNFPFKKFFSFEKLQKLKYRYGVLQPLTGRDKYHK